MSEDSFASGSGSASFSNSDDGYGGGSNDGSGSSRGTESGSRRGSGSGSRGSGSRGNGSGSGSGGSREGSRGGSREGSRKGRGSRGSGSGGSGSEDGEMDSQGLFLDPKFPPEQSSLGGFIGVFENGNTLGWVRPQDMAEDASLFKDGVDPKDIMQGCVGDCWFLGGLCAVAEHPALLKDMVAHEDIEGGKCTFRFFKNSEPVEVTVDTLLPVQTCPDGYTFPDGSSSVPICAQSATSSELWVSLLEKAYAKLYGSYFALDGGHADDAVIDLVGGMPTVHKLKDDPEALFSTLLRYESEGRIMVTSCHDDSRGLEGVNEQGIVAFHAYAVLAVVEHEGSRLVRLRNPWGKGREWNGRFGDGDAEFWTDEAQRALKHEPRNEDGEFFMSYDDYVEEFDEIVAVLILGDAASGDAAEAPRAKQSITGKVTDKLREKFRATISVLKTRGAWAAALKTNGSVNKDWGRCPQYHLKVAKDATVEIMLQQDSVRGTGYAASFIGFQVFRVDEAPGDKIDRTREGAMLYSSPSWTPRRQVSGSVSLNKGHYVIVPSPFAVDQENSFTLIAAGPKGSFALEPLGSDAKRFNPDDPPEIRRRKDSSAAADDDAVRSAGPGGAVATRVKVHSVKPNPLLIGSKDTKQVLVKASKDGAATGSGAGGNAKDKGKGKGKPVIGNAWSVQTAAVKMFPSVASLRAYSPLSLARGKSETFMAQVKNAVTGGAKGKSRAKKDRERGKRHRTSGRIYRVEDDDDKKKSGCKCIVQ